MVTLAMTFVFGVIGAVLGWGAGSNMPGGLKEIAPAFALFSGLLAAILGAVLGGLSDITRTLHNRERTDRPAHA
jgi:hypothetical protein